MHPAGWTRLVADRIADSVVERLTAAQQQPDGHQGSYGTRRAAAYLSTNARRVRYAVESGRPVGHKSSGRLRFRREDLDAYASQTTSDVARFMRVRRGLLHPQLRHPPEERSTTSSGLRLRKPSAERRCCQMLSHI